MSTQMKFLKRKIQRSKDSPKDSDKASSPGVFDPFDVPASHLAIQDHKTSSEGTRIQKRNRVAGCPLSKHSARAIKNMAKNYGRAICNFALSTAADEYVNGLCKAGEVNPQEFRGYLGKEKDSIEGIDTFRGLLLISIEDDHLQRKYKKIFQKVAEIFIKLFSVNWIFDGKVTYKQEYLKYRFKMLRRVKKPELFTYIK
jgi:hypothetical protein